MDGKAQLRRYLEQRRDLGETEFVLDGMSVDEALRALGAIRTGARNPSSRPPAVTPSETPPAAPVVRATQPADDPEPGDDDVATKQFKPGLIVGSKEDSLFEENPFNTVKTIDGIAKLVHKCTRCDLYKTATNGVPGEGDPRAGVMCVGEAPGATEDETGRPFVGAAGQLLTKILAAIELTREEVFIANVLKHRPPGNRNPRPDEVAACSPYLIRQIELVKPKVIIAFGTFAAQTLLDSKTPIGKLRGLVHRYYGVPLIVTYHPAALLRNPAWKRPTWEDVQLARKILDSATK